MKIMSANGLICRTDKIYVPAFFCCGLIFQFIQEENGFIKDNITTFESLIKQGLQSVYFFIQGGN